MMVSGFAAPVGTMSASDLYNGVAQYASPPPVQEQVNQGTGDIEAKATKTATKETTGVASGSGFELPVLVAMFVAAIILVRYY